MGLRAAFQPFVIAAVVISFVILYNVWAFARLDVIPRPGKGWPHKSYDNPAETSVMKNSSESFVQEFAKEHKLHASPMGAELETPPSAEAGKEAAAATTSSTEANDSPVYNRTLGFQEIMYLSMSHRTDRQDGMSLLGAATEIDLKLVHGVSPDEVHAKAIPAGSEGMAGRGPLGTWRAHANAWKKMVNERIETALILEDDADWDPALKHQLDLFSRTLQQNASPSSGKTASNPEQPYGPDWDVLFVGACKHDPPEDKSKIGPVVSYADHSTPPRPDLQGHFQEELELYNVKEDGMRAITRVFSPICLTGYAVSLKGAERLLFHVAWERLSGAVDNAVATELHEGTVRGLLVTPPLISMFKTGNLKDSDNDPVEGAVISNDQGHSPNLITSMRNQLRQWVSYPDMLPAEQVSPPEEVSPPSRTGSSPSADSTPDVAYQPNATNEVSPDVAS